MSIIRRPFRYRNDNAVYWLIGINILIFGAGQLLGRQFQGLLAVYLSMVPAHVLNGWVWTLITYMFMHGGFGHIFFNMLGLFIFGTQVERHMGSREFVLFYLVTGFFAGLFSFAVYYLSGNYYVFLMGASGAIFAVEFAYAVFFPNAIIYIWGILPLRAPVMVLAFTALELFSSVMRYNSGVAHFTHLAGFGFAWLYFVFRFGINPWRRLTGRGGS